MKIPLVVVSGVRGAAAPRTLYLMALQMLLMSLLQNRCTRIEQFENSYYCSSNHFFKRGHNSQLKFYKIFRETLFLVHES